MREILKKIVSDKNLEAGWLNTVSLLEHIGSLKIARSVCVSHPSVSILQHFADEARHAVAFKKLALELVAKETPYLCKEEGVAYFQLLDQAVSEWIELLTGQSSSWLSYLFVTSLIERRAMKLYPLYMKTTLNEIVRNEVRQVIDEENSHRHDIEEAAEAVLKKHQKDFSELTIIEEKLFGDFEQALATQLGLAI